MPAAYINARVDVHKISYFVTNFKEKEYARIMKQVLICWMLTLTSLSGFSQQAPTELYELILNLLPDSTQSATQMEWTTLRKLPAVSWQSTEPVRKEKSFIYRGSLPVSIQGRTFSCEPKDPKPCPFKLTLEGNENAYTKFSIDHLATKDIQPEQNLSYLFANVPKHKVYRKNSDSGLVIVYTYELRFPGKKKVWLMYATMKSQTGNGIFIKIFFDKKDLDSNDGF